MNWALFLQAFVAIFVAEIGDKTQLATLSLSTGGSKWSVFLGSAAALVCTSALAVLAGEAISRVIPPIWMKRAAGVLFLVLGVLFLMAKPEAPAATEGGVPPGATESAP